MPGDGLSIQVALGTAVTMVPPDNLGNLTNEKWFPQEDHRFPGPQQVLPRERSWHHTQSPFHQARAVPLHTKKTIFDAWNVLSFGCPPRGGSPPDNLHNAVGEVHSTCTAPQGYTTAILATSLHHRIRRMCGHGLAWSHQVSKTFKCIDRQPWPCGPTTS